MRKLSFVFEGYMKSLYKGSYIILISGLSLILASLTVVCYYFFLSNGSEVSVWVHNNVPILIDTFGASLCITLISAILLNYSHKRDKK